MRILQVGLGGFGRDWAVTVIPRVPEVEVVGTADVFAGFRELAIAAGITTPDRCFSTVEEAIEATDPEAVWSPPAWSDTFRRPRPRCGADGTC